MNYLQQSRVTAVREQEPPRTRHRQDGYGSKLPQPWVLQLDGKRWYRIYSICWGTGATSYVVVRGEHLYLDFDWRVRACQTELIADRLRCPNGR